MNLICMSGFEASDGAGVLLDTCLAVKPGENALIVTDTNLIELAGFLASAARDRRVEASVITMAPREAPGVEPPAPVAGAMKEADMVLMLTTHTLAPSRARAEAQDGGARIMSLGGYNFDVLRSEALKADFQALKPVVEEVAGKLTGAEEARVTTCTGTELYLELGSRLAHALHNICHEPGTMGSPPDVEAYVAPIEDTAEGRVVVDGAVNLLGFGLVQEPIELIFDSGRVTAVEGGSEARHFQGLLESYGDPNMYRLGELGIGLNPRARLVGDPLIDEGVLGTAHIALGLNYTYGGTIKDARTHIDCVFKGPTIELDGELVLVEGKLVKKG
jgi:leucyl aminopeptidase (aminopeptidase T)